MFKNFLLINKVSNIARVHMGVVWYYVHVHIAVLQIVYYCPYHSDQGKALYY